MLCAACDAEHDGNVCPHEAKRRANEPYQDTLTTLRAENERLRAFVQWVADREDAEDVTRALTDWDHADVYRTLGEAIDRARAALKGGV